MSTLKTVIIIAAALPMLSAPVVAATAHNSQAGAFGPTKNPCAATAYFPADSGCLSSFIQHSLDEGAAPPPRYLRRRSVPAAEY